MTKCNGRTIEIPAQKGRKIEINFGGGSITNDGGVLLLTQIDQKLGLTQKISHHLKDNRDQSKIRHSLLHILKQRVYGIALGYEDLNDHEALRLDPSFQTSLHKESVLASSSTLCRFENKADRQTALMMHKEIIEQFIASFKSPPKELILDFDATDDLIHGEQVGRFFHGYYGNYCFLPLYVFCGSQLLVSYLRPSNIDGAKHTWAILALLVKRLRQTWPDVKILFRGDSGFCRHKMLSWCDRHTVSYIVGIPRNKRLEKRVHSLKKQVQETFIQTQEKQKAFMEFTYAANSWTHERRIIAKIEENALGSNVRFITTNLQEDPQVLYETVYCARGDMENRIKEVQLNLFADRTSCHGWWPNQLRVLFSSLAYILLERLKAIALQGTDFARAQAHTIRLKLLKIGGIIIRNTRRIRFMLSEHYPLKNLFFTVLEKLQAT